MKKGDIISLLAIMTVVFILVIALLAFLILPSFGLYGLYELFSHAGLIDITYEKGFIKNFIYFGFVLFIMYLITLIMDLSFKGIIFIKRKTITVSKNVMMLSYFIQSVASALIFKSIADDYFLRIDISFLGSFLTFMLLYLIYFILLDDDEIEQ